MPFLLAFCTGNDSCAWMREKDVWKYVYGVLKAISIFTVMFFTDGIKQMFFMPLMVCVFLLMLLYIQDGRRASMA